MHTSIQKIEKILNIKLGEYNSANQPNNYYSLRKDAIEMLKLDGVVITGEVMDELLPYLKKLRWFKITNATVSNISELLKLQVWCLHINNVVFKNDFYQKDILQIPLPEITPGEVYIKNTKFNAAALEDFERLTFLFLTNCHITNFHELCNRPNLYQLELTKITFGATKEYVPKGNKIMKRLLLSLTDCDIEDMNFFLPFAENVWSLTISNSRIKNIAAIRQFSKMDKFEIDASSVLTQATNSIFTKLKPLLQHTRCEFTSHEEHTNLEQLAPIADYFTELSVNNCNTKTLSSVALFTNVTRLRFENCAVHLAPFLPIAQNIQSVYFRDSTIKTPELWRHFTQLDTIRTLAYEENKDGLGGLKNILPLSNQLKRLCFLEDIEELNDIAQISQFTGLEALEINTESIETAKEILSISTLKKLKIGIYVDEKHTLNLEQLKHLQVLHIAESDNIEFIGFEQLNNLESLETTGDYHSASFIDVNHLPAMPKLKRLAFDINEYSVEGLAHFPNLEELKISGVKSIQLKHLHHLKVLDLSNNIYVEILDCFDDLPQLEKLALSEMYCDNSHEVVQLTKLKNLKNLKWLSLMETTLKSLDGLEELTSLEYLDLYQTSLTDVRILNQLKNLKEVNLAMNNHQSRFEIRSQLDRPEIAIFKGLPSVQFRVWKDLKLWENYY